MSHMSNLDIEKHNLSEDYRGGLKMNIRAAEITRLEAVNRELTGKPSKSIMEIPIPISLTEAVTIRTPYPLTEQAWNQMLNILKAYKPTLVPSTVEEKEDTKEN